MKQKGFTIIELLVALTIVGLLALVIFTSVNDSRIKARDLKRKEDIKELIFALASYYSVHHIFPTTLGTGPCGTPVDGTDPVSMALIGDKIISTYPKSPSDSSINNFAGVCGQTYYAFTWNNDHDITVYAVLEKVDPQCVPWVGNFTWTTSNSYCNAIYTQVL